MMMNLLRATTSIRFNTTGLSNSCIPRKFFSTQAEPVRFTSMDRIVDVADVQPSIYSLPFPPTDIVYEGQEVITRLGSKKNDSVNFFKFSGELGINDPKQEQAGASIVRIFTTYVSANLPPKFRSGSGIHVGKHIISAGHCLDASHQFDDIVYTLSEVHYTSDIHADHLRCELIPCKISEKYQQIIKSAAPLIKGPFGIEWGSPINPVNDIGILEVEKDNREFPGIDPRTFTGVPPNMYTIGYPSFITEAQYLSKNKNPKLSYPDISGMFYGFEAKVSSVTSLLLPTPPKKLHGHDGNTLGGMSGGGVFVDGKLIGVHLGGFSGHQITFNVFYPINTPLFKNLSEIFH